METFALKGNGEIQVHGCFLFVTLHGGVTPIGVYYLRDPFGASGSPQHLENLPGAHTQSPRSPP